MSAAVKMPQCRNKKLGTKLQLYGKGSKQGVILDVSISTRKRADKLNQMELSKLHALTDHMDRHARYLADRQQRLMGKLNQSLEVLNAYHHLVSDQYRVDNFDTLKWGYTTKKAILDPDQWQKQLSETRIYHSGFSIRNLRREVNREMESLKPERNRQKTKEQLIGRMKQMCAIEPFDRTRSLTMIIEDFKRPNKDIGYGKKLETVNEST